MDFISFPTKPNPAPSKEPEITKTLSPRVERLLRILADIERQDMAKTSAKAAEDNQQN
jgi:hypothetical protein